LTHKVTSVA
jgi:hypothetical protein